MPQHLLSYDWNSGAPANPQHMSWVALWQLQHSTFANPIWHWETLGNIEYFGQNMKHGSPICGRAAAFTGILSKFRCNGKCSAYILSHVMTAPAQHICQSRMVLRHSRRYWVLRLEYETRLAMWWQSHTVFRHMINVQGHWKDLRSYPYAPLITTYFPIPVSIQSVWAILSTFVRIWDTGSRIGGKATTFACLWSKFWCTGES